MVLIPKIDWGDAVEPIMTFKDFEDGYSRHINWLMFTNQGQKLEAAQNQKLARLISQKDSE